MSDLVKMYEASQKTRVVEAKQIPSLATNFFDPTSQFAAGFTPNLQPGDEKFTDLAQQYYNEELKTIVIPDGFQPLDQGISLNRWTPDKKYFTPGQPTT